MANSVTTNPIVLDTAGVVSNVPVTIKAIQVVFGNDSDFVVLADSKDNVVYYTKAGALLTAGATDSITVPGGIKTQGLKAVTISLLVS